MTKEAIIEKARQRAKDNNQNLAQFYVKIALKTISSFRNTIFLTAAALIPYSHTIDKSREVVGWAVTSIAIGIIHFFVEAFINIYNANIHSTIEKSYANIPMSKKNYEDTRLQEEVLRKSKNKGEMLVLLATAEAICLLIALISII